VSETKPIEGADKIEAVIVDGWQVVSQKGNFKPGQKALMFEIDSYLPICPAFEFLRKSSYKKMGEEEGFRLRSIRLKKTLSQGLLLPLAEFPNLTGEENPEELQTILGVKKYEAPVPACISGDVSGAMPSFIRKTDQERIQNLGTYPELYKNMLFEVTEKLDGTSCTYYLKDGVFGVCGRNWEQKENPDHTFWKIAYVKDIKAQLLSLGRNLAFQGEVCGEGIQDNSYKIKGHQFFLFDIFDIDAQRYFPPVQRRGLGERFGLDQVPHLGDMHLFTTVYEILGHASGNSVLAKTLREGVVFKSTKFVNNDVISFKSINNDFLLAET